MIRRLIKNQILLLPPTTTTTTTTSMISNSSSRKQTHITKRLLSSTTTPTPTTPVIITSSSNDKSWKEIAVSYYNSYSSSSGVCTNNNRESSTSNNNNQEMVSSASTSTSTTSETLQQQQSNNNNEKMKKRKQLAVMIETSVRKRLKKQFPKEFDNNNNQNQNLTSLVSFQTLLALNGYQRIVIPTDGNNNASSRLYLAEGVVVTPRPPLPTASSYYSEFTKRFSYNNSTMLPKERLYVRSQQQQQQQMKNPAEHESLQLSNFVQEDITLYRIIENSAAQFIDRRYLSITGFFDRRLIRPFTDVKYRTRIFIKTVHSIQQKFQHMISPSEKSLIELLIEKISNSKNNKRFAAKITLPSTSSSSSSYSLDDTTNFKTIPDDDVVVDPVMLVSSATPPLSSLSLSLSNEEEKEDKDPLETLMVISSRPSSNDINNNNQNDEIILSTTIYNSMTPSTRLLALGTKYYLLQHSSASTLVSCSIVIFGAIPLSYRSYLFSIQYSDLLSSTSYIMAISVVGTISYGILSSRWKSQTSQSYIISNALCERIYSRNEASYYLLQQNAIQYITQSIVKTYENHYENKNNIICYDSSSNNSSCNNNNNNNNHNHNKDVLVNPIEWAIDFGLLMKQEQEQEQEQEQHQYYKAIPLEDALKCMNMNMNADS